jgi:hypothetical protein
MMFLSFMIFRQKLIVDEGPFTVIPDGNLCKLRYQCLLYLIDGRVHEGALSIVTGFGQGSKRPRHRGVESVA